MYFHACLLRFRICQIDLAVLEFCRPIGGYIVFVLSPDKIGILAFSDHNCYAENLKLLNLVLLICQGENFCDKILKSTVDWLILTMLT
jgi:hypothetical protein